jgi:hypothetical protein
VTAPDGQSRISYKERIARGAVGMPANHIELLTCKPSRAEWQELAAWLAELWPNDEYTAIVAEAKHEDGS